MSQVVASMVDPDSLVAKQHDVVYDFRTLNQASLRNIHLTYDFAFDKDVSVHGLAGWFVAEFIGKNQTTTLSTAPEDTLTHWFQVRFLIPAPLMAKQGQSLSGSMDLAANEQQSYDCSMEMTLGEEIRSNSGMSLMDLDSSLKQYSYKIVTHGNVSVACVDWQKTTDEARAKKHVDKTEAKASDSHLNEQISLNNKTFRCVKDPEKFSSLKLKSLGNVGKIGGDTFFYSAMNDPEFSCGLIRKDVGSGEETFYMEIESYTKHMIGYIAARKQMLQEDWRSKSDDEIRSHFQRLKFEQVVECYQALLA